MSQLKYLNLGCGRIILPAPKPAHYGLVDDGVTDYALWHNVDKVASDGVDECVDIFRYPFPWSDNSFDGALLSHLVEHVPHEIRGARFPIDSSWDNADGDLRWGTRWRALEALPDGFYAFFSELHRVLTPGATAHILVPYAFSTGAMQDPDHKRYLTPESFTYLMPNPDAPFVLPDGGAWAIEEVRYGLTEFAAPYQHDPVQLQRAIRTQWNIAYEFYVKLRVVKLSSS